MLFLLCFWWFDVVVYFVYIIDFSIVFVFFSFSLLLLLLLFLAAKLAYIYIYKAHYMRAFQTWVFYFICVLFNNKVTFAAFSATHSTSFFHYDFIYVLFIPINTMVFWYYYYLCYCKFITYNYVLFIEKIIKEFSS